MTQFLAKSRLAEAVCTEDEDEEVAECMTRLEGAVGGVCLEPGAVGGVYLQRESSGSDIIPHSRESSLGRDSHFSDSSSSEDSPHYCKVGESPHKAHVHQGSISKTKTNNEPTSKPYINNSSPKNTKPKNPTNRIKAMDPNKRTNSDNCVYENLEGEGEIVKKRNGDLRILRKNTTATQSAIFPEGERDPWLPNDAMTRSGSMDSNLKALAGGASILPILDNNTKQSNGYDNKGAKQKVFKKGSPTGSLDESMRSKRPLTPSAPGVSEPINGALAAPPPYRGMEDELPDKNPFMRTHSLDEATLKKRSTLISDTLRSNRPRSICEHPGNVDLTKAKVGHVCCNEAFYLTPERHTPGGPHLRYVLTCVFKNSQKRVHFSE